MSMITREQALEKLGKCSFNGTVDRFTYLLVSSQIQKGDNFDFSALLSAAEQGQLTVANATNYALARVAEAASRGESASASSSETETITTTKYVTLDDGTVQEIVETVSQNVRREVSTRNLGRMTSLPANSTVVTGTAETGLNTKAGSQHGLIQYSSDGKTTSTTQAAIAIGADGAARQVLESTTTTGGNQTKVREIESAQLNLPAPLPLKPCRDGAECRNRKCTKFSHPENRPLPGTPEWNALILCRDNGKCTRRGCNYAHFKETAPASAAPAPAQPYPRGYATSPETRVIYARFTSETREMRRLGEQNAEATWALVHPDDYQKLAADKLVPPMCDILPEDDTSDRALNGADGDCLPTLVDDFDIFETPANFPSRKNGPGWHCKDCDGTHYTTERKCSMMTSFADVSFGVYRNFKTQDFGGRTDSDTNMCFWLSICNGNRGIAEQLKAECARYANHIAREIGAPEVFGQVGVPADTEAVLAYVWLTKRPVCIAVLETAKAIFIRPSGASDGDTIYLHLSMGHYTRLVLM